MSLTLQLLERPALPTLAIRSRAGAGPAILFLPGFRSDMTGAKATALADASVLRGRALTLFDYRGHGGSEGRFEDGVVGDWRDDALAVLDQRTRGPVILVGSSMGGWIALLVAAARPERIAGIVGIAAAPDFTADLIRPALPPAAQAALDAVGIIHAPSPYGDPIPITRRLLDDGDRHLVLRSPSPVRCPAHLVHGRLDAEVPWTTATRLAAHLEHAAVTVELVEDGDHRLSRPDDLHRIIAAVERMAGDAGARATDRPTG